ncbi:hypothetical protein B0T24DRAFT_519847 [Lasiosphaeria ovina]|uniref:USP domain-containing protein n=1 Tax=Lasiosphaeria ovina TaxID=92902 RepID=A0AAE0NEP7_9PEZI|nr:hypothetical protein B0T24DRAFT_519847 [Lasiosphaeria ovina]
MAQASTADESRERAVSSEPCSTRPNPFDDSDISSRKRRRTSLSGASRSRSVDTVNSASGSPLVGDLGPEAKSDSAMKIDTDPTTPITPENQQQPPQTQPPPSGPRSSRVTINVRTPSRPLEAIPSSPPSPSLQGQTLVANVPADAVQISVEESEVDMSREDTVVNTPLSLSSSSSDGGSPPIEIISAQPDDDDAEFGDQASVTILDGFPHSMLQGPLVDLPDPTADFPFRDVAESYSDVINRLTQYLCTHDTVSQGLTDWIEKYLAFARTSSSFETVVQSFHENREVWVSLPEIVFFLVNRKSPYPRAKARQDIFGFFKAFASLSAYFIEFDIRSLMQSEAADYPSPPDLVSQFYVQALSSLTRKEEIALQTSQLQNADDDFSYLAEVSEILDTFHGFHNNSGGSFAFLCKLIRVESGHVPRFPKLTDSLGYLCAFAANFLEYNFRKMQSSNQTAVMESARGIIARGYALYISISAALANVIDKHVNHLSSDGASNLLTSLTEIFRISLSTSQIVPTDIIKEHRQNHPPISLEHVPEAMAYHWKFTTYSKLIMSSQMQLRVMAVSAMCTDLVQFWRKFNEPADEPSTAFLQYVADFLLRTGLVAYILGPTCHPEITIESSNIVGFLLVSGTYTNAHTDALWQTVTSTQDPRVSDALIRMTSRITNLYPYDSLVYLAGKLNTVGVEAFGPTMREFCEQIFRYLHTKSGFDRPVPDPAPFDLCVRLIRQSSAFGPQSPVAHADIQQFAIQKFKEILGYGPATETRRRLYLDCFNDIAQRSSPTIGSLWVMYLLARPYVPRELHALTAEHDLTRLLIDELEDAIPAARSAGFPAVLSGPQNTPRKELLMFILYHESPTITKDLGPRLWHLLVGPGAACREDRDVAWQLLNNSLKRHPGGNPFTSTCFSEYLPALGPECFCLGTLEFVREGVLPLVNDATSIILDDDESLDQAGIEQLWRLILTAPENTIEQQAIHTLVNDVYVDSRSILSFPHYRARKVHLALVSRCLRQLSSAAAKLMASADGATSGDDDSMVIVVTDQQLLEQELLFIRSLSVLREFHRIHQAKAHFSAPDLRALILDPPNEVEGDSAELKFQSFDGDVQTEVKPLEIGKRNTAASLLASLREATGFNNYRIYYRGRPFAPQESEICKSLEDLQIQNGIILVKRESDTPGSPARVRLGASPVEVEILGHFEELWEYLSMEQKLSQEIYSFLVKLPADENILKAIGNPSTSYQEFFPLGQAFKSLYAVHALREYLGTQRRRFSPGNFEEQEEYADGWPQSYSASLIRAMSLLVPALSDPEVIAQCPSQELQMDVSSALVECFVALLKDPYLPTSAARFLDAPLLDRLLTILLTALSASSSDSATKHATLCLRSILESCCISSSFMSAFCAHSKVPGLFEDLLLHDQRAALRQNTALLIVEKVGKHLVEPNATTDEFREFFWPLVSGLVGPAIAHAGNSTEVLHLCYQMFEALRDVQSRILDVQKLLDDWSRLLLAYTTFEDLTQPDIVDHVASSLIQLLHTIVCSSEQTRNWNAKASSGLARQIFWKHLFPPVDAEAKSEPIRPVLNPQSRIMLTQIMFGLIDGDSPQTMWLLEDLDELVPVFPDEEEFYGYELLQQFERSKAVRSPCGYVGLKNLSNTCYLNSLFTQLFMNVDFRRFMLKADVRDTDFSQALLFQTQKLFGFMQGSIRRYVSPDECVANIKTYEDTQIDIHNQMDVDEFYNLLFDRWEGQLLTSEEKHQFRSFYGGQLVQQVSSKECEHISERLEPFSAIQCDIKGKSSLQESLQAYVDGEIMEGADNKYKCSTCDRHVDAVKRACLKDVPDNLIFHLKRFDFNLRTLQRSKINDYFSFPSKVDMRPYTIDHLSNPADEKSEDIFELVGILVHSGTAESGHYYSYIRERPSQSDSQVWVEFNDDVVTPWDPAMTESSCFGGPDYRSHFENNTVYDKTYSAYMLFYQRSSSLAKAQELLKNPGCTSPLRVPISRKLDEFMSEENNSLLRRHCLYDPYQIEFVKLALHHMKSVTRHRCSRKHDMENLAITMALSHLDQVASRTKDAPDFFSLAHTIDMMCQGCVRCSLAAMEYFSRYTETVKMLVQKNPDAEVRQGTVNLMIRILQVIKAELPVHYGIPMCETDGNGEDDLDLQHTTMRGVMLIFKALWENFHTNLRSWPEVFDLMFSFVKLGRHEIAKFLEHHFLKHLLYIIYADQNLELPQQFARMITTVTRRTPSRPPSYERIIGLIDVLIAPLEMAYTERGEPTGLDVPDQRLDHNEDTEGRYLFTRNENKILHTEWARGQSNVFVDKLITINQNPAATDSIITNLIRQSNAMEEKVFRTLRNGITGQITQHSNAPFLHVAAAVFCRVASRAELINSLIEHVSQQCMSLQSVEGKSFLDFERDVFDCPRENANQSREEVILAGLDNIPEWAPGLLGYFDSAIADEVEAFLQENLFQYSPSPVCGDTEEGRRRSAKLIDTARTLGMRCLGYLRDNYVARRIDVSTRIVAGPERVIKECSKYFNLREPSEDEEAQEFLLLSRSVLEPLHRLTVEELEEDGSGMFYSDSSSIASSVTAG